MAGLGLQIERSDIAGVLLVRGEGFADDRGVFSRLYCQQTLGKSGADWTIRQASLSENYHAHTLRGFHFQLDPKPEDKLVTPLRGAIYDVVIDLRKDSKTYLQWRSFDLSSASRTSLIVPKGCANAWMTLVPDTMVLYNMSEFFEPSLYAGIRYNDPLFKIRWPQEPKVISEKDRSYPDFKT